jgi:hypothetical protein
MRCRFLVLSLLLLPAAVRAEPFAGSELFVGRSMKQPAGAKLITTGINFEFAPMNLVLSSQKDAIVGSAIDQACARDPNPTQCRTNAKAYTDTAMKTLAGIPDSQWEQLTAAANDQAALNKLLNQAGITDPAAIQAVDKYVAQVPADQRTSALGLSRKLAQNDATNLQFEPFAELNLAPVQVSLGVPLVVTLFKHETQFNLGNINLDGRMGWAWDLGPVSAGVSAGLGVYLPTGMTGANGAAMADLFMAPKYLHNYLTVAPYVVAGLDVPAVTIQMHLQFLSQFGVRGSPAHKSVQYLQWGAGVVILPDFFLSIIGEINGLVPAQNSKAYKSIFAVGGLQFKIFVFKAGVAAQIPIVKKEEDLGSIAGIDMGKMASFSILGRAAFEF